VRSTAGDLALGLDLGTSSLKALVLDSQCRIVASASRAYPLERPAPGYVEQQPEEWWQAVVDVVGDLAARGVPLDQICCIGLSGQMHGLVLLNKDGEPVAPCQTWADARCIAEAREIAERIGSKRLRAITGSAANTSATAAKLLWLRRHEPERYAAARHLLLPKDYLRWRLTGAYATDASDASGTLLCDVAARDWSGGILDALDIPASLLPRVCESPELTGTLSEGMARELGMRPGIPVVAGGGDAECAALGMGLVGEAHDAGCALATLGTAGQFFAVTDTPRIDTTGRTQTLCHVVPGRWHVMTAILAGGSALSWLAGVLLPERDAGAALDVLLAVAAREPVRARGLLFVPHLQGVRVPDMDPAIAGAFVGLRPEHTRAALVRAAVEGVGLALREGLVGTRDLGIAVEHVRLAGAVNRSPFWAQVQADVFGVPVEVGITEDASALGAALLAAVGSGLISSLVYGAKAVAGTPAVYQPDPDASAHYATLHARMDELLHALRPTFSTLARG
jgi:xylulokinase